MLLIRRLIRRLKNLLAKESVDREMDEEMAIHLDMEIEANLREGMTPEEARRRALISFGGIERFREQSREARGGRLVETMLGDLRLSIRKLRRRPLFTTVVVLTLALGIGATTAIFSVVNGVLLRPLPYPSSDRLVLIWDRLDWVGIPKASVTGPQVADLREQSGVFEGLAAFKKTSVELTGLGDPRRLQVGMATANLFEILGIDAPQGRTFLKGEDVPDSPPVVLLTHGFWQREYGGDPSVIGNVLTLDQQPVSVVGVLPPEFNFKVHRSLGMPSDVELWTTLRADLANGSRGNHEFAVLARLRDGVTFERMYAEMDELGRRQDSEWFGENGFRFSVRPVQEEVVAQVRPTLFVLMGAVGLLLLIAVGNIATLMLARAQVEVREVGVRAALGASPSRISALAFSEVTVLALLGGGAIDFRVFSVAAVLTFLTVVLCGLGPALHNGRLRLENSLRHGGGRIAGLGRATRARKILVAGEVALAMVLVIGSGLLFRSLALINSADPGFSTEGITTLGFSLPSTRYPSDESKRVFLDEFLTRIRGLPGIEHAAAASTVPLLATNLNQTDASPDALSQDDDRVFVDYMRATPGYFEAMGLEVIAGRALGPTDVPGGQPVAVIDQTLARYWPQGEAVGHEIDIFGLQLTVVGVVNHARLYRLFEDDRPQIFIAYSQFPESTMSVAVRSDLGPSALVPEIRRVLAGLDPGLPLFDVNTIERLASNSTADRRFATVLLIAFALSGLFLAAMGVYGILAFTVANRSREIGVRMALGAHRRAVGAWILREGLLIAGIGAMIGLAGALAASRLLSGLVVQISPLDPVTFVSASFFVILVAGLACALPARRACFTDPVEVMKSE